MTIQNTLRRMFHAPTQLVRRSVASLFGINDFVYSAITRLGIAGMGVMAASGVLVNPEAAMQIAAYKRGVELLSHHVAKTCFSVKNGCENDTSHPASPLIRWWARHHQMSAFEFRRTLMVHSLTSGNGYAYIVRERGVPVELLLLQNAQVFPEIVKGQLRYRVTGRGTTIAPSDMIHIKGLGFNGYQGLDPIRYYAKEVLGLAIATQNYAARYYENGGTPSAYLKSEIPLTDDQFNRLKGEAGPLKRSADNPHELPVLEMTDIKSVGLTAEQTQLLSARKDIVLDIANLLGIPPHKLGLAISTSYGSLEEENDAFRDDALDPWLVQFEMEYRKLLLEDEQQMETHSVSADRSEFSRMKSADQAQYISSLTGSAPTMTVNEGRRQLGLSPIDGGDELMKPMNMGNVGGGNANNFQPPAGTPKTEAAAAKTTTAEELSDETPIAEARQQAMEDVFRRMSKRLATAASRIKRPEQLEEFRSRLDTDHLPVITAALTPIVPLCGGKDAGPIATAMVAEFRSRLGVTNAIESLDAIANQFMEEAGAFASEALRKMVA